MAKWYEHEDCLSAWLLDEASAGDAAVDAAGYQDLADTGSVGRVAGQFGNAADLSGSNYLSRPGVDVPLLSLNGVHFTVMCWVKYYASTVAEFTYPTPLAKWGVIGKNQWEIRYNSTSRALEFNATVDGSSGAISATFGTWQNLTTWQHLAVTFDGINVRTYLDGTLVDTVAFAGINVVGDDDVDFTMSGRHAQPVGFEFRGNVDEAAVFHGKALTQANLAAIISGGLGSSFEYNMDTLSPRVAVSDLASPGLALSSLAHPVLHCESLGAEVGTRDVVSPDIGIAMPPEYLVDN